MYEQFIFKNTQQVPFPHSLLKIYSEIRFLQFFSTMEINSVAYCKTDQTMVTECGTSDIMSQFPEIESRFRKKVSLFPDTFAGNWDTFLGNWVTLFLNFWSLLC